MTKAPMINRGVPLRVPKRQIITSRGQGRLHHQCEEDALLWRVRVQIGGVNTALFGCPNCKRSAAWYVHVGLIFGTRQLRLHALECPVCQATGDIKPATPPPPKPAADQPPADPNAAFANPVVGPQRFGVMALECVTCGASRPVDPVTGILETEVQMEQGVYGLDKTH